MKQVNIGLLIKELNDRVSELRKEPVGRFAGFRRIVRLQQARVLLEAISYLSGNTPQFDLWDILSKNPSYKIILLTRKTRILINKVMLVEESDIVEYRKILMEGCR